MDDDIAVKRKATAAWNRWENQISQLIPNTHRKETNAELDKGLAIARIEAHYFVNTFSETRQYHIRAGCTNSITFSPHRQWPI